MFITTIDTYIPEGRLLNSEFEKLSGLEDEWIVERTGIRERALAKEDENANTMAIEALKKGLSHLPYDPKEIDLIVGASYTPYDTIVTLAHHAQHFLGIDDIPTVYISSACSSLLNAIEIVQGYFALGKSKNALVLVSDNNSRYSDPSNRFHGHLWGDAAAALFISNTRQTPADLHVTDVITGGAATKGKALTGVNLITSLGGKGLFMENGRDVFQNACTYMAEKSKAMMEKHDLSVEDIRYFIPHQANKRISLNVMRQLGLPEEKLVSNIERYGNTGCVGSTLGLAEVQDTLQPGDKVIVSVFGGGYSFGTMLLECENT